MSSYRVRVGQREDLAHLVQMWRALVQNATEVDVRYQLNAHSDGWFRDVMSDQLLARTLPFPGVLVAEHDGSPVAFLTMRPKQAHPALSSAPTVQIGDLYVSPPHRGSGVGADLVARAKRTALDAGYSHAELHTLYADERAMRFWQAQGFRPLFATLRDELSNTPPEETDEM